MKNFKRGTPAFGLFLGALLLICGALIMWLGFWRTLVLALLFAVGYFLGAVQDKSAFVRDSVSRVMPEKKSETIDFRREVEKQQESLYTKPEESADSAEADGETDEEEE